MGTNGITLVGLLAAAVAAGALLSLSRPVMTIRTLWPALTVAALGSAITIGCGLLFDIASPDYLVSVSALSVSVLLLLEAAAISSGADGVGRWVLLLVWGLVVFPLTTLVPLWVTRACGGSDCELQDFGGALPLVVSAAAFVVLAWLPAGVVEKPIPDTVDRRRAVISLLVLWAAFVVWMGQLEGAIDDYVPRIVLSAVVGPLAGGIGWLIADRVRDVPRPLVRSVATGMVAGIVATMPGAVTVGLPWNLIVGVLAGALGSLSHSSKASATAGLATRWGLVVLVACAVGFVAPAIAGDTVGILFSAHFDVLSVPAVAFLGVGLFSMLVSAPAWVLLRHHAARERVPDAIRTDDAVSHP